MLANKRSGLLPRTWHPPSGLKILNYYCAVSGWNYRGGAAAHQLISEIMLPSYAGGWFCCFLMSFAGELIISSDVELLKFWPRLDQISLILLNLKSHSYPVIIGTKEGGICENAAIS